jgi:hypothetical protein
MKAAPLVRYESFEILDHQRVVGMDAFRLEVDSDAHQRAYTVEWQFANCDDRMAIVRWADACHDWCTHDLPPNEVHELYRFLECNDWLAERVAAAV